MSLYVVRLVHPPDQCPTANSKVRDAMTKGAPEIPRLAEQLGIKFLVGPLVLGTEHEALAVVEAQRIETVEELLLRTGLVQWNSIEVTPAPPLQDSMRDLDKVPPPLH